MVRLKLPRISPEKCVQVRATEYQGKVHNSHFNLFNKYWLPVLGSVRNWTPHCWRQEECGPQTSSQHLSASTDHCCLTERETNGSNGYKRRRKQRIWSWRRRPRFGAWSNYLGNWHWQKQDSMLGRQWPGCTGVRDSMTSTTQPSRKDLKVGLRHWHFIVQCMQISVYEISLNNFIEI